MRYLCKMDWAIIKKNACKNLDRWLRDSSTPFNTGEGLLENYRSLLWFNGISDLFKVAPLMYISRDRFRAELTKRGHSYYEVRGVRLFAVVNGEEFEVHEDFQVYPVNMTHYTEIFMVCSVEVLVDRMEGWSEKVKDAEQIVNEAIEKRRKLDLIRDIQYCNMKAVVADFRDSDLNVALKQKGRTFFLLYGLKATPYEYWEQKITFKGFRDALDSIKENIREFHRRRRVTDKQMVYIRLASGMPLPWRR